MNTSRIFYRLSHYPPRLAYAIGLGPVVGRLVLLLTTTGRKSGRARVTPLQYEEIGTDFYVGAAHGQKTDWVRNIKANPLVSVRVGLKQFDGEAKIIVDPELIAGYLDYRLKRHPRMMGAIFRRAGLPPDPNRIQLHEHARKLVLVCITPEAAL